MSYGQIAAYLGFPKGAREVGQAMRTIDITDNFPWWRVLSSTGKISLKDNLQVTPEMQQRRLEDEGVIFHEELVLDISTYRYRPDADMLISFGVDKDDVDALQAQFGDVKKGANPAQISLF